MDEEMEALQLTELRSRYRAILVENNYLKLRVKESESLLERQKNGFLKIVSNLRETISELKIQLQDKYRQQKKRIKMKHQKLIQKYQSLILALQTQNEKMVYLLGKSQAETQITTDALKKTIKPFTGSQNSSLKSEYIEKFAVEDDLDEIALLIRSMQKSINGER